MRVSKIPVLDLYHQSKTWAELVSVSKIRTLWEL